MRISDWSSDVCSSDLTAKALAGAVGMERTHGAIMAGVHCGQQIKALRAADFAKDDTIRTHTQGVLDEVANGDPALPFKVRRTRFQAQPKRLLKPQFGCVLECQPGLPRRDHVRKDSQTGQGAG